MGIINADCDRIDLGGEKGFTKSNNSKECIVCHCRYSNHGLQYQNSVCNGCHDLMMLCLNLNGITIITVKNIDYRSIIYAISKSDTMNLLENSVLDDSECI